ncbi:hypothetical protein GG496_002238 [Candidatus Fervidibacteria bacterium JGI MDM2 JNZ-1-D12]
MATAGTLTKIEQPKTRWALLVVLGCIFTAGLNFWVLRSELYTGASNIAGGNPPVPVLLALSLLLLLRRFLKLSDAETLSFYLFACFALLPTTLGGVRSFFPTLTAPLYYASPDNRLKEFWEMLPNWWAPKDTAIVRGFFEGVGGRVPWGEWIPALMLWTVFFVGLWAIGYGVVNLLAPFWLSSERLNFPLAQLPLQMVRGVEGRSFFASRLVWFGIALGATPTAIMAFCSFFREVRRFWDLAPYLVERPFNALRPLMIFPLVEGVGFGYLVPQEVLLSVWLFYFILKLIAFFGIGVFGWEIPAVMSIGDSFPFPHSQSVGGYLAIAVMLLWRGFKQKAWQTRPLSTFFLFAGSAIVVIWMVSSGMSFSVAFSYWLVLTMFVITYARIRAEVGMPYSWVYPYGAPRDFLHYAFGITGLLRIGGVRSLVLLSGLFWVARHYYLNLNGAYAADAVKIVSETNLQHEAVTLLIFAATIIGLWAAFIAHLTAYYSRGANFLEGAPGTADYRTYVAAQDYRLLSNLINKPMPPDKWRIGFTIYGAVATFTLAHFRRLIPTFPLHPLGFPLAYAYSHHCPYWFPTLFVWAVKGLILRYGGMSLHRRLVPLFLGIALGHFLMTGVIWGGILYPLLRHKLPFPLRIVFEKMSTEFIRR